jgi:integrase
MQHIPPTTWEDWVLEADHLSNKAFNGRRSHLSAFLSWCYEEGLLLPSGKHLARVREKPNTTFRAKTFVKAADMPAVLEAAGRWHERDRFFLAALWHSWRRSGELCSAGAFVYFLIQAPVWCGAITRQGQMCRTTRPAS